MIYFPLKDFRIGTAGLQNGSAQRYILGDNSEHKEGLYYRGSETLVHRPQWLGSTSKEEEY